MIQTVNMRVEAEMELKNVVLHPLGSAAAPVPELLCIFGTGDLGRSLGLRLLQSGYRVVYGSRRPHSCGPLPQGAQVRHGAQTLSDCRKRYGYFGFVHASLCLNCVCYPGDEPRRSRQVCLSDLCLCSQRTL